MEREAVQAGKDDRSRYVDMLDDNKEDILRKLRGREERYDVEIVNWDDREKEKGVSVRNKCKLITTRGLFTRQHKPQVYSEGLRAELDDCKGSPADGEAHGPGGAARPRRPCAEHLVLAAFPLHLWRCVCLCQRLPRPALLLRLPGEVFFSRAASSSGRKMI